MKRGCDILKWDASFKEAKHLAQHHGQAIFRSLITGTNGRGEIRIQFHVVTDGQDQFTSPIEELLKTLTAYGQEHPVLFFTDQPTTDKQFFTSKIPSLHVHQVKLDRDVVDISPLPKLPRAVLKEGTFFVLTTVAQINTAVASMRKLLLDMPEDRRIVALDAEWDTIKDSRGQVIGSGKVIHFPFMSSNHTRQFSSLLLSGISHTCTGRTYTAWLR